ncbi:HERV-H LTR-associating protein 1, partial [Lonchura striata]
MLGTALRGTKKHFSLLSITSYSSFAFHKVSVTIYNISNAKNIDPGKFPMHYCYCLNNVTNDLTATRTPLAQKGGGLPTTKFPLWPKTAGAKGSWFPSPHGDAPRPQGMARPPLSPGGSLAPSPALQPSPSEYGQEPAPCTALGFAKCLWVEAGEPFRDTHSGSPITNLLSLTASPICNYIFRYCVEYYSWFVKNASYVCERVKRVAYSHS